MATKPSARRNYKAEEMELNITPMMNLIAILIPCLLVSVAFVELTVVRVAMPSIGPTSPEPPPQSDRPPLNLEVKITDKGYLLTNATGLFADASPGHPGLFISVVDRTVSCSRFLDTVPPPRSRNSGPPCKNPDEQRSFVVYDTTALAAKAVELKDRFPEESRVIIRAEPAVQFEAITDAMDALRDTVEADGTSRPLFEEVILGPSETTY